MNFNELSEAIDAGGFEHGFHPSKRQRVEGPSLDIEKLFPDLGPEAQRYLEHITSASYKTTLQKVARYLQVDVEALADEYPDMNTLAHMLMTTIFSIDELERNHKDTLEHLALRVVLDLPEFSMIKQMYQQEQLTFDIKLLSGEQQHEIPEMLFGDDEADEDGLAPSEELAMQSDRFDDEEDIKRELANFMMAGNAVNKMYLFHLVEAELNQLNPELVTKYGIVAALGNLGYYMFPDMDMQAGGGMAAGVEKIDREHGVIYARGLNLPVLIHEIVKGIWEYLSADVGSAEKFERENVNDEVVHIMAGPEMYRQFQTMIPDDKMHLLPLIYKLMLTKPTETIKMIMTGGQRAQVELDRIINQAEGSMGEYEDYDDQ